jgi:catechol 1,2-dioxygenase
MHEKSEIHELTETALAAFGKIENARIKEIVEGLIRYLHGYVKEIKPTDQEWEFAWTFMAEMAKFTSGERNEYLLLADVIGVSQLIAAVNHQRPPSAAGYSLAGPVYRANAPSRKRGESIASNDTPGDRVRVTGKVYDIDSGTPIRGTLDVWQAATNGLYENQDKNQPDYNLRGRFETDDSGTFELIALMPTGYPAPTDGPVAELLRIAHRSPYRPAHIHFIVFAPNYETFVTQVFVKGDEKIATDVVFIANDKMIGDFHRENGEWRLNYDFELKRGISKMPKAPIGSWRKDWPRSA